MVPWTIDKRNPVIPPGVLHPSFDEARAGAAHIVKLGNEYRMVYWGSDRDGRNYILQAQSPITEPNRWRPLADALIGPQLHTTHNNRGPGFPFLLPVTDTRWHLYFTGWGTRADGKLPNTTGLAISDDRGATWHYHPGHPVIPLDRHFDAEGTGSIWILHENDRFRMYYTAIGRYFARPEGVETGHGDTIPEIGIAYAESADGIHWEKPVDQLLIAPRGFEVTPYEYICSKPCVVKWPDSYVMWVNTFGTAYRVHRLTSADGLHSAVAGAVGGYVSLWLVFHVFRLVTGREGMGYGDFKLFAASGAWLGWQSLPLVILVASFAGAILGISAIIILGRDRRLPIPFGPFLCAATWIALIWG